MTPCRNRKLFCESYGNIFSAIVRNYWIYLTRMSSMKILHAFRPVHNWRVTFVTITSFAVESDVSLGKYHFC